MDIDWSRCRRALKLLLRKNESKIFYEPTELATRKASDKKQDVNQALNLSVIKARLDSRNYYSSPERFVDDVRLVFSTFQKAHPTNASLMQTATELWNVFQDSLLPMNIEVNQLNEEDTPVRTSSRVKKRKEFEDSIVSLPNKRKSLPSKISVGERLQDEEIVSDEVNVRASKNEAHLQLCEQIIDRIMSKKHAKPFIEAVDAEGLGLHDYYQIVKKPMDLGTIKHKLQNHEYTELQQVVADVKLVVTNCQMYNERNSPISRAAYLLWHSFSRDVDNLFEESQTPNLQPKSEPRPKTNPIVSPKREKNVPSQEFKTMTHCKTVLGKLMAKEEAKPFAVPVDPIKLKLPNYFAIIRRPMDLGTVKERLDANYYRNEREFKSDVRLVFSNCQKYNEPKSPISKAAYKLSLYFDKEMDMEHENSNQITEARRETPSKKGVYAVKLSRAPDWKSWCANVLKNLMSKEESVPFHRPVNAQEEGLEDYYEVIENPMDLGTIQDRLQRDQYTDISQFVADVHLVFANCRKYNESRSEIYSNAYNLSRWFKYHHDKYLADNGLKSPSPVSVIYSPQGSTNGYKAPIYQMQTPIKASKLHAKLQESEPEEEKIESNNTMSEYELERLKNIERNREMMKTLGLDLLANEFKTSLNDKSPIKKKEKEKFETKPSIRRISTRNKVKSGQVERVIEILEAIKQIKREQEHPTDENETTNGENGGKQLIDSTSTVENPIDGTEMSDQETSDQDIDSKLQGRFCHNCHTNETTQWRRGPDGRFTLCNSCGLHWSKYKNMKIPANYKKGSENPNDQEDTDSISTSENNGSSSGDKCCAMCSTKKTPYWRRGPSGPNSLCNACGLRWQKCNTPQKLPSEIQKEPTDGVLAKWRIQMEENPNNCDLSYKNGINEETALHVACDMGNIDIVGLLMQTDIDMDAKDAHGGVKHSTRSDRTFVGMTAVDVAVQNGFEDIVKLLQNAGHEPTKLSSSHSQGLSLPKHLGDFSIPGTDTSRCTCCHTCRTSLTKYPREFKPCSSCMYIICKNCFGSKQNLVPWSEVEKLEEWNCPVCVGTCLCSRCITRGPPRWFGHKSTKWTNPNTSSEAKEDYLKMIQEKQANTV